MRDEPRVFQPRLTRMLRPPYEFLKDRRVAVSAAGVVIGCALARLSRAVDPLPPGKGSTALARQRGTTTAPSGFIQV